MSTRTSYCTLSPRDSKLLVEVVIGVIGILGMMLALAVQPANVDLMTELVNGQATMTGSLTPTAGQVDWLALLF